MRTAWLFPGQGSQFPGMLRQLPAHPAVKTAMEEAAEALQSDVYELDTAEAMKSTVAIQLLLLISGVAMARVLLQEGGSPSYVAGHSVGAFGAAVISGALGFRDALRLVKLRACLMEQAFPSGYGMGVIAGMRQTVVEQLVEEARGRGDEVYVANVNAPQQITVAGGAQALARLLSEAGQRGARRAEKLQVPVPSHCPLLLPVEQRLGEWAGSISFSDPQIPYAANTTARLLRRAELLRNDLIHSISRPVLWHDAVTMLYEHGARLFIEMPPGQVLSNLMHQASYPSARPVAAQGMSLDSLVHLMQGE